MKMPDKLYDILKWVTMIVIPGLGTLYSALASIWGFPLGEPGGFYLRGSNHLPRRAAGYQQHQL